MARKTKADLGRPLLVGEAPSRSGDRFYMFPLSGRVARTLCELAGIAPQEEGSTYGRWTWALYDRFECVNLFERYADATPWDRQMAATMFGTRLVEHDGASVVICLGRNVQHAMKDWFVQHPNNRVHDAWHSWWRLVNLDNHIWDVVVIPHPSRLNRLLDDPVERVRCSETLREALRG